MRTQFRVTTKLVHPSAPGLPLTRLPNASPTSDQQAQPLMCPSIPGTTLHQLPPLPCIFNFPHLAGPASPWEHS